MKFELGGTWEENFDGTTMQCAGIVETENVVAAAFDEDFCKAKERARRIVACVNACAGIPTDDLEMSPEKGLFHLAEFANKTVIERDSLRELCGELKNRLIASQFMFSTYGINLNQLGEQINESITKAEKALGGE